MSGKKKERNMRRWTKKGMEKFAQVFADPTKMLPLCLNKVVRKKLSNSKVCEKIRNNCDIELAKKEFLPTIKKNNFVGRWKVIAYQSQIRPLPGLTTSSIQTPSKQPLWFKHIDPAFTETNTEIHLSSVVQENSFMQDSGWSDDRLDGYEEEDSGKNTVEL